MTRELKSTLRARCLRFGLASAVLALPGLALPFAGWLPALAAGSSRIASIGPGVNQNEPASHERHAALRCATPAKQVHFKEQRAIIAVAVGMAESYCRPHATGVDGPTKGCPNGSEDRGLWQINSCYNPQVSKHCAYTPACNARAAKKISDHGKDWEPWSTYNDGAYKQYLPIAKRAVKRVWD